MWGRSLFTASAAASLLCSTVQAGVIPQNFSPRDVFPRNDYDAQPPCTYPFTPFVYSGCYVDPSSPIQNRALDYSPTGQNQANMTVEWCTASCKANGFRYAGLEYYGECFCGDAVNGPAAGAESDCSYACTGNNQEVCGGFDYVSVYQDPTFNPVNTSTISDYMPVGCYSEGTNGRAINFQQNNLVASTMTTEICLQACKNEGYPLAATEYASECFCGVVIGNGSTSVGSSNCNMACAGLGGSTALCTDETRHNFNCALNHEFQSIVHFLNVDNVSCLSNTHHYFWSFEHTNDNTNTELNRDDLNYFAKFHSINHFEPNHDFDHLAKFNSVIHFEPNDKLDHFCKLHNNNNIKHDDFGIIHNFDNFHIGSHFDAIDNIKHDDRHGKPDNHKCYVNTFIYDVY
ncbi:hypothetical protein MMC13_007604 [Lambiella insularis]|nr:hypothetical protein [Lambiella insularis]